MMQGISEVNPFTAQTTNAASPSSSSSSTSNPAPVNQLNGNSFLSLLTAQLKSQDPLNPLDPNAFVTELVQFNQLQQLININQTLSKATTAPATGSSQANQTQAASPAASTGTL